VSTQLSIVVPCCNEEESLPALISVLTDVLPKVEPSFEVILIDDGSQDGSLRILREAAMADTRFRYISLSRNFGKEAAMLAGLSHSNGNSVAFLDADLQHPPQLLAEMLPKIDEGFEQVVGRRTRTHDPVVRSIFSRLYYRIMNRLIEVRLHDGEGDFRLLSRPAASALLTLGEYNRFSKGLYSWIGFRTAVIEYENQNRVAGATRWRFRELVNYGIDGILSFNSRPLRLSIWLGAAVTAVAFVYALWVLGDAIWHGNPVPGYVTTICIVVGFGGIQMIMLGVIGEYLGRIYLETKRRPHFLIRESSDPGQASVTVPLGPDYHA
jgi:glycosyltransferase involved in cell wall biosynthesis